MKKIVALMVTLLAGCGALPMQFKAAEEPTDGDRARLRVIADGFVRAVPGKRCIDWSAPGAGTVFGGIVGSSGYRGRSLGMPAGRQLSNDSKAEMYVAANRPITLVYMLGPENRYRCSVAFSFVPEKAQDYEASIQVDPPYCRGVVRSLTNSEAIVKIGEADQC